MVGSKTNTEDYYQAMDIFVFPSLWEGLGIVAIEAQANGLPCILSENIPDDVMLTNYTHKVPLSDVKAWVSILHEVKKAPRSGCSAEQYQKLLLFDSQKVAAQLQAFYWQQGHKVREK